MKRFLLILCLCSVALNLWLSGSVSGRVAPSPLSASPAGENSAAGAELAGSATKQDPAAAARLLRAIEETAFADARAAARRYWLTDGDYELNYVRALLAAQATMRAELIAIHGAKVASDPAFRLLFRPLDPLFDFLTSEQQLEVQRLRLERDLALERAEARRAATARAGGAGERGFDPAEARLAASRYREGLAALLDRDLLFEFLLRDSALAQQLRANPVALSESEFRQVFAVLDGLETGAAGPDEILAAREALRGILGRERFARFWSARDPAYARIETAAERHGVPTGTVDAIYALMSDFQDRQIRLAAIAADDPERSARDARSLAREEREALALLVGDELAAELLNTRAIAAWRLLNRDGGPN